MATATYVRGDIVTNSIDYTAAADLAVNTIVVIHNGDALAGRIGVTLEAIANGAKGRVATTGVWNVPKVSAAVIKAGECVNWDTSADAFDDNAHTTAAGDIKHVGMAMSDAGNGVTTLDLDISHPGAYDAA